MEICVIIPAYNASQYIDQAINSVVMQTVPITEIIVDDDGSTDNTSEIVKTVAPNVILVKQSNSGPSAARNRGLDLAQGDVVAFLDADDLWFPNKIEQQLKLISPENGVSAVATAFEMFDDLGSTRREVLISDAELKQYTPLDFAVFTRVFPSLLIIDRRIAGDVRFPQDINAAEDLIYMSQIRAKGQVRAVEEVLVRRRHHKFQLTRRKEHHIQNLLQRLEWIRDNWSSLNVLSVEKAEHQFWNAAADAVLIKLWERDLDSFQIMRQELLNIWPCNQPIPPYLTRRLYPKWLYHIKDAIDSLMVKT